MLTHIKPYHKYMYIEVHVLRPTDTTGHSESGRAVSDECRARLGDPMGQGELEVGHKQLFDVGAANIFSFFDFYDTDDLACDMI